jgi:hypothetical protein
MEQNTQPQQPQYYGPPVPTAPVMSVGGWIVTFLLMIIPLVNIIMIIVWAASGTENPNRKNWAIATLIMWAVYVVLMILFWSAIAAMVGGVFGALD